jgi:hypothetical protein
VLTDPELDERRVLCGLDQSTAGHDCERLGDGRKCQVECRLHCHKLIEQAAIAAITLQGAIVQCYTCSTVSRPQTHLQEALRTSDPLGCNVRPVSAQRKVATGSIPQTGVVRQMVTPVLASGLECGTATRCIVPRSAVRRLADLQLA